MVAGGAGGSSAAHGKGGRDYPKFRVWDRTMLLKEPSYAAPQTAFDPDELLDQLLAGSDPRAALADGGLLDGLKKALAERVLNAEFDHHLDGGEPDGRLNGRNGYGAKTVLTSTGKLALQIPRDRLATFDPQLIAKYQRRFPGFDERIVSM